MGLLQWLGLSPPDPEPHPVLALFECPPEIPLEQWQATPEMVEDKINKALRDCTGLCPGVEDEVLLALARHRIEQLQEQLANQPPPCPTCGYCGEAQP